MEDKELIEMTAPKAAADNIFTFIFTSSLDDDVKRTERGSRTFSLKEYLEKGRHELRTSC
ncbi:hypothetical protein BSU04nite_16940 [Bacillus spizizenii]|nr:hypothetical protein BSU04nite_16940 [Bacillus spizizenii]